MGMDLVGTYISTLRSATGLSQPDLAAKIGVHERTIRNMERGTHEPKPTDLALVLEILHGSWIHISQLLSPSATKALAEQLAKDVIDGRGFTEEQRIFLETLTPEQKAALLSVARQMRQL
jgi:transcriptional regulator with XRE-family HTH domain